MDPQPLNPSDPYVVPPHLQRRATAALGDAVLVALCLAALFFARSPLLSSRAPTSLAILAGSILAAAFVLEALTGRTPGKLLAGLSLTRPDQPGPGVGPHALRAVLRWIPVYAALPAPFVASPHLLFASAVVTMVLAIAAVQACYLSLVRTGSTIYDWAAHTRIARAGHDAVDRSASR